MQTLILAGTPASFPEAGHWRRWDPTFAGAHMIAVYVDTGPTLTLFDPLAPMQFVGDTVTAAQVLTFSSGPDYYARTIPANSLVPVSQGVDSMLNMSGYPQRVTVNKGDPFYAKAGDAKPVGHYAATGAITVIGRVLNPGGWYLAQTNTGAGYQDGQRRPSGVYLHLAEPVAWLPAPVIATATIATGASVQTDV